MKKKSLTFINLILVVIIVMSVLFIVFTNTLKKPPNDGETVKDDGQTTGVQDTVKLTETAAPGFCTDPEYEQFRAFNENINMVLENRNHVHYSNCFALGGSLKTLYEKAKDVPESEAVDYPVGKDGTSIKMKVLDSYLTRDEKEIGIPDGLWSGLGKLRSCHTEDGQLLDGYTYCVVELQVTNTSGSTIDMIMTNPVMELHFLDDDAERYAWGWCCLFTYQPGDSEKNAAKLYDFKSGDSFTSKYVFAVSEAAFKYFDCCLAVSPRGSAYFYPEYSTMVVLKSLSEKE